MSAFTDWSPLDLRQTSAIGPAWARRTRWVTLSEIRWEVGELGSGDLIVVPVGFGTDLASVPRVAWSILPPWGEYSQAAVLHDYLYDRGHDRSRRFADRQFLDAMAALDVPRLIRWSMWLAVRAGGWARWRQVANRTGVA